MLAEGVLAYWFDLLPTDIHAEWADWYIRDHMPSRVGATFTSVRSFRAVSGPAGFMALFQTKTPEALISPEYLTLLRNAPEGDRRKRAWYKNIRRGCCRTVVDIGQGEGGVVGSLRFSSPKAPEPELTKLAREVAEELTKLDRIGRAAYLVADPAIRATMDQARVSGHDDGTIDRVFIIECSSEQDWADVIARLETLPAWKQLADPATIVTGCFRPIYTVRK